MHKTKIILGVISLATGALALQLNVPIIVQL